MAFQPTHWSLIAAVNGEKSPEQRRALEILSGLYRRPAYQHIRARGYGHEDAEDMVQAFFADWLHRELFGKADPSRGRFRNFFLTVLDNFILKSERFAHARRRYPEGGFAADEVDSATRSGSPDERFWRTFANDLIHDTLVDVVDGFEKRGMAGHAVAFRAWFVAPVLDGASRPSQRELAARLETSEKQVTNMLITVKRSFRKALETRVREYAANEEDVALELEELMGYARYDNEA